MKAFLILEDGTVFPGRRIGADRDVISEIVFNTTMAGYTEVLTDPSYAGQAVCMTYPLIGNYGVCMDDLESGRPWPDALIVRELARVPSNFRSDMSLGKFMDTYDLPGIEGIDTRKLTRILREKGTMNGGITSNENYSIDEIMPKLRAYTCGKVVEKVTCSDKYEVRGVDSLDENGPVSGSAVFDSESYNVPDEDGKITHEKKPSLVHELTGIVKTSAEATDDGKNTSSTRHLEIALLDLGTKKNIARCLSSRGCNVTVYPAGTKASEILATNPDGIMLSNGPGDPKECTEIIKEIRKLYESDTPIFAICLGHQLMALATGADTYKLKYGHRGGNHPVKDLSTGRVYISSQNHGYAVDMNSLDPRVAVPSFTNVNDGTNEGLHYVGKNIFTVQFHPEACAGPQDTEFMFDRFLEMVKNKTLC